jgi:hypothetical protein
MKKKVLIAVVPLVLGFILLVSPSVLAGEYDGVWTIPDIPMIYFLVYNTDTTLVVTEIDSSLLTCDVLAGQMNGSVGSVQHLVQTDNSYIHADVNFTSPTTATFVVKECSGNCTNVPIGVELPFQKIF